MIKNLTEDPPGRQIAALAVPLLIGNVFQTSYNLADIVIIGRFAGPEALAGIGIASPVFNLINALLIGMSAGSSILISQLFGGGKSENLSDAVVTIHWISLALSLALTIAGQFLVVPLLSVLQTPAEDMAYASVYLRAIFPQNPYSFCVLSGLSKISCIEKFGMSCPSLLNFLTGMHPGGK